MRGTASVACSGLTARDLAASGQECVAFWVALICCVQEAHRFWRWNGRKCSDPPVCANAVCARGAAADLKAVGIIVVQVAEQQGRYLARVLNAQAGQLEAAEAQPFQYRHLGSMASIGGWLPLGTRC